VGLVNTAELVFIEKAQVRETPESVSQAENAGSIPVTRSIVTRSTKRLAQSS
jgi:hypothetical protein